MLKDYVPNLTASATPRPFSEKAFNYRTAHAHNRKRPQDQEGLSSLKVVVADHQRFHHGDGKTPPGLPQPPQRRPYPALLPDCGTEEQERNPFGGKLCHRPTR